MSSQLDMNPWLTATRKPQPMKPNSKYIQTKKNPAQTNSQQTKPIEDGSSCSNLLLHKLERFLWQICLTILNWHKDNSHTSSDASGQWKLVPIKWTQQMVLKWWIVSGGKKWSFRAVVPKLCAVAPWGTRKSPLVSHRILSFPVSPSPVP